MGTRLEKKWGFFMALAMVMGTVIGSGIFFKAVKVLKETNGNMKNALVVIAIVGAITIICSTVFAEMGRKYSNCNGLIDYAEATCGKKYAYFTGWFMAIIYYPVMASTICYVAANYFCLMLGLPSHGQATSGVSILFLMLLIMMNVFAPKLSGKFQTSTLVIKLIPIILMGVVGTVVGIVNGNGITIFNEVQRSVNTSNTSGLFGGVCAFIFAYEGWISSTTINSELKNPKRDLPLALIVGTISCTVLYMLYVYSMSATLTSAEIMAAGDSLPQIAFSNVFGNIAGNIILGFIVVSCLGASNGVVLCSMRGLYSLAIRGQGPKPDKIAEVDETTGMPLISSVVGIAALLFWMFQISTLFFHGSLALNDIGSPEWLLAWEADEICIITLYAVYIPIYLQIIFKEKGFNPLFRFVLPPLALIASVFMCYCAYSSYGIQTLYYIVFFVIVMGSGMKFYKKQQ